MIKNKRGIQQWRNQHAKLNDTRDTLLGFSVNESSCIYICSFSLSFLFLSFSSSFLFLFFLRVLFHAFHWKVFITTILVENVPLPENQITPFNVHHFYTLNMIIIVPIVNIPSPKNRNRLCCFDGIVVHRIKIKKEKGKKKRKIYIKRKKKRNIKQKTWHHGT